MPDILTTTPQDDTVAKQIRDLLITARSQDEVRSASLGRIVEQLDAAAAEAEFPPHQIQDVTGAGNIRGVDYMPAENLLYQKLRTAAGSSNMVVTTTTQFSYTPPSGKIALVSRVLFDIIDGAMQVDKFGGLAALSNGVKVEILDGQDDSVILDFLDGSTIKSNFDFSHVAGVDAFVEPTAGDDELLVRWSISKTGVHLYLPLTRKFAVTIQDNLTGIAHFDATIQGILVDS